MTTQFLQFLKTEECWRRTRVAFIGRRVGTSAPVNAMAGTVAVVLAEVSGIYDVTAAEIRGHGRTKRVGRARQHAMAILRDRYSWSYPEIGLALGRDHTTVIAGVRAHHEREQAATRETA